MAVLPEVHAGSDAQWEFEFVDSGGTPMPIQSASIVEASGAIRRRISLAEADFAAGRFRVVLDGSELIPRGQHSFNAQALLVTGEHKSTGAITFDVV